MKKFKNKNYRVQFKTESAYGPGNKRKVFYRVVPSELNLWDKIFNNKWTELFHPSEKALLGFTFLYTPDEYRREIDGMHWLSQVEEYLESTRVEISRIKTAKYFRGEIWYDEV